MFQKYKLNKYINQLGTQNKLSGSDCIITVYGILKTLAGRQAVQNWQVSSEYTTQRGVYRVINL